MEFEPFPGSWAIGSGLTRSQLESRNKRIFPDVWIDKRAEVDFRTRSLAAGHWMKGDGVLSGFSASALHGAEWIDPHQPAEITTRSRWRKHAGLTVRRQILLPEEIIELAGFHVTTAARTAYDLARGLSFDPAVIAVDALAHATKIDAEAVLEVLENHPTHSKRVHVRAVAHAMDGGAESPQETRTRLTIVEHGLPRPETQIIIRDARHSFVARCDMGYRQWRVLIEYEGGDHDNDEQLVLDVERYYLLDQLGWKVLRVTKDLLRSPWLLVDRVERALREQGWRPE
ncbi:DUF559 domain-containing protein [Smaragdicoccus niigatensis]|uniref:DUF559 domain-containing protein n=1 Tax=Smaragdicoccus niigatensis TaxID=359359 RepID=UPI00036DE631|nr:DUF559 domain-containing protein [Smaragdicoccus niigatensis]